jgi:hypothetical protein
MAVKKVTPGDANLQMSGVQLSCWYFLFVKLSTRLSHFHSLEIGVLIHKFTNPKEGSSTVLSESSNLFPKY